MYYVEVIINQNCGCSTMVEGLLVEGTREEVMEKVKKKFKTAKNIHFKCLYMCEDIGDGVKLAFSRYI